MGVEGHYGVDRGCRGVLGAAGTVGTQGQKGYGASWGTEGS